MTFADLMTSPEPGLKSSSHFSHSAIFFSSSVIFEAFRSTFPDFGVLSADFNNGFEISGGV